MRALLNCDLPSQITLDRPKNRDHGDYATSISLGLAKAANLQPRVIAEVIIKSLTDNNLLTAAAYSANKIQPDLIPVATRTVELGWGVATVDEPPRPQTTLEALGALKTPFRSAGRVTAGNAAGLNDGATAAILASESKAKELNLPIKARMVSFAFAGVEPEIMGYGPVPSTIKALKKAGLDISDIGLFEVNEAFAIQVLSFLDHFGIADDDKRVNIYGGAIAVGHPLASSGVRLILNLANGFKDHPEVRYGITTMCIGLGMGGTIIWENPNYTGGK